MGRNLTWSEGSQLSCYFEGTVPVVHPDRWCVEVSFNGGRSYTNDCPVSVANYRAPVETDFLPKLSLISDPTIISVSGIGFVPALRYWCLFVGPGLLETSTEATVISSAGIQCEKPVINSTEETHELEFSVFFSPDWQEGQSQLVPPILARRFEEPHTNQAYAALLSVSPDRGDYLGGTPVTINLRNNPTAVASPERAGSLRCRFMATAPGEAKMAYTGAVYVDEAHLNCTSPDFSHLFEETWVPGSLQEVEITVSEVDGTFRARSSLRYRYYRRPEIIGLWPDSGYAAVATQVTLSGKYFVNFADLSVRSVGIETSLVQRVWTGQEVLFMDSEHLLIELPAVDAPSGKGRASRIWLEVSLNGGVDWATLPSREEAPLYTFRDEPQIFQMSHSWTNLRGGFVLVMEILHLGFEPSCLAPSENYGEAGGCGKSSDIAWCHIGAGTAPLTHINATFASCLAPSQPEVVAAPVSLVTNGGTYLGGYSYHLPAILRYLDDTGIHGLVFPEGIHSEEVLVEILGNFTALGEDTLIVNFGTENATEIVERSEDRLLARRPPRELPEGKDRRRVDVSLYWVEGGLLFRNASVQYQYKNYSVLTGIWPERGPSSGGTIIEVRGVDLDQEAHCWLRNEEEALAIPPLWVSRELLLCETPSRGAAAYSFELRWGGGAYLTDAGLTYTFDPDPHVLALSTSHVTMRAHDGGVRIGLIGWHFVDGPDICVRIAGAI